MPIFDKATFMAIIDKIEYGLDIATAISIIGASGVFLWDRRREAKKDREDRQNEAKKDRETKESISLAEREAKRTKYLTENTKIIIDELSEYQERMWFIGRDLQNLTQLKIPESGKKIDHILLNEFLPLMQELINFLGNKAKRAILLFSSIESQEKLKELQEEIEEWYKDWSKKFNSGDRSQMPSPADLSIKIGKSIDHFYEQIKADFNK